MYNYEVVTLLKQMGVHPTAARAALLAIFLAGREALSFQQISRRMSGAFNRVTIYRTLDLFVEKGLIHILPSVSPVTRYGLLENDKDPYYQKHLHFLCDVCGRAICLGDIPVPRFTLPAGFKEKETEVVITGECDNCSKTT
jgi:Fur family ferric uptake transcriptional regulator